MLEKLFYETGIVLIQNCGLWVQFGYFYLGSISPTFFARVFHTNVFFLVTFCFVHTKNARKITVVKLTPSRFRGAGGGMGVKMPHCTPFDQVNSFPSAKVCVRDLNWNLPDEARWLFLSHFWPQAVFFEAAGVVSKISSKLIHRVPRIVALITMRANMCIYISFYAAHSGHATCLWLCVTTDVQLRQRL